MDAIVTGGDGSPCFSLYARALRKHMDDPSPAVTFEHGSNSVQISMGRGPSHLGSESRRLAPPDEAASWRFVAVVAPRVHGTRHVGANPAGNSLIPRDYESRCDALRTTQAVS